MTVEELRNIMTDYEFDYWFSLHFLGIIGYESEDRLVARIERRIAFGAQQHPERDLELYRLDPFRLLPEEDEEFMDMVDDGIKSLKERLENGEFDYQRKIVDGYNTT